MRECVMAGSRATSAHPDNSPRRAARGGTGGRAQWLAATGGLLGALAASSCCVAPLVLFTLGASGAWIGGLAAMAPYQPLFVAATLGFVGAGFYMVYRKPSTACAGDAPCAPPRRARAVKAALWSGSVLAAAAVAFPYVAPLLLAG